MVSISTSNSSIAARSLTRRLVASVSARLASEEIRPDAKGNWLDLTHNDFDDLLPVIDKDAKAKAVTKVGRERAVFKLFGNFMYLIPRHPQ